jgi:hypothetical protein
MNSRGTSFEPAAGAAFCVEVDGLARTARDFQAWRTVETLPLVIRSDPAAFFERGLVFFVSRDISGRESWLAAMLSLPAVVPTVNPGGAVGHGNSDATAIGAYYGSTLR